ncbi:hypothetical protein B0H66DRAFT_611767 [Apodospora peruviana]|uniref:GST N-terminal domain-containing protein n=1 Tax=Apodospora peruviana TaxID=516989 RepID=A0AAE0MFH2_9PEZI|nr:hypothetical protein B0H66DRAFT_611767 [Apodospora peruviana]
MDSAYTHAPSQPQPQSQSQLHSHSHPHSQSQRPLHFHQEHHQQTGFHQRHRSSHHDLSALAVPSLSIVDAQEVFPADLHGFTGVYKARPPMRSGTGNIQKSHRQPERRQLPHQRHVQAQGPSRPAGVSLSTPDTPSAVQFGVLGPADGQGPPDHQEERRGNGHLPMKMVPNPPDLAHWRRKLFELEELVVLSQEEFETYFPWVDNVYSHRSTQRYKRKPFVTHYWDCRLKGRPPGTAKSDDPNKKKRKRLARERDQCNVKIKITEYSAGAIPELQTNDAGIADSSTLGDAMACVQGRPFWTIQRINGNGMNNVGDGKPETHRHTLAKSDEIKKNSVQRWMAVRDKDSKKSLKPSRWKATGDAAITAKKHANDSEIKFYAACFCPFSQRVWIALEAKGLQYQYCETDPFHIPKPTHLLEANPRGLVPAIRQDDWACGESTVILEYLEDLDSTTMLYPTVPRLKANCRLWIDFINTKIVPSFHTLLAAAEDNSTQAKERLERDLTSLLQAADEEGPFFLGTNMCLVDIHFAPFALWLPRLPTRFKGWTTAVAEARWNRWLDALERNPHIRNTTSTNKLYADTVDRLIQGCQAHLE